MMRRLLEMSGFQVTEAVNGVEAVSKAELEDPEIILMDLSLPLVDGLAATRRSASCLILRLCQSSQSQRTTRWIFTPRPSRRVATPTSQNRSITVNSRTSLSACSIEIERKPERHGTVRWNKWS